MRRIFRNVGIDSIVGRALLRADYLNVDNRHSLIYRDEKTKKYRVKIKDTFGRKVFDTLEKAKIAVFRRNCR
jgi:hypothetical protein